MKRIIAIIIIILCVQIGYSQPMHRVIDGNLNDITEKDFLNIKNNDPSDYLVDVINLGEITIDSTTNLNRVHLLSKFNRLALIIKLDTLPKEFLHTNLKTEHLSINGDFKLKDISSINAFRQLKELVIEKFSGKQLSKDKLILNNLKKLYLSKLQYVENLEALTNLDSLTLLYLNDLLSIEKINAISHLNALETLTIDNTPKLKEFPKLAPSNQLISLYLEDLSADIQNLKYLEKLKALSLEIAVWDFPDYLPPNMEGIIIEGNPHNNLKDISNINNYEKLTSISLYSVKIKDSVSTFPTKKLNYLSIKNSQSVGNLSFIYKFKKINQLHLENLNRIEGLNCTNCSSEFDDVKLQSIKGVEHFNSIFNSKINNSIDIAFTSITSIPKIKKLKKISTLDIRYNRNLQIDDVSISEDWKILENWKE